MNNGCTRRTCGCASMKLVRFSAGKEATHMPFRDGCAHCIMGRGRTHHHASKKRSGLVKDQQQLCTTIFLKPNSSANSQTVPDESVTCIAVEEDIHQNIVSSVVLKTGVGESWASERVASWNTKRLRSRVMQSQALIAFRNRVLKNW